MTLAAVVASLDTVPEAFRAEYRKGDDGKFYLDVNGVDDMPAVIGLKRSQQTLLDEKKQLEQKLKGFGEYTPEKIEELKKAAEGKTPKNVEELQKELDQVKQNAQREIQAAKDEAEKASKSAQDYFLDSEISRVLAEPDVKGSPELLAHVMRSAVQVEMKDGKMVAKVMKDGTVRIKDAAGNPFTLKDLALELKADAKFGRAFEPTGRTGSGADGGNPPVGPDGVETVLPGKDGIIRVDPEAVLSGKAVIGQ